jgi:hypothetical protein
MLLIAVAVTRYCVLFLLWSRNSSFATVRISRAGRRRNCDSISRVGFIPSSKHQDVCGAQHASYSTNAGGPLPEQKPPNHEVNHSPPLIAVAKKECVFTLPYKVKIMYSYYRLWQAMRVPGGWGFRILRRRHMKVARLLVLRTGRLYSQEISLVLISVGARGSAVIEALRYKPEGRGIDSRWCHWNFSLT